MSRVLGTIRELSNMNHAAVKARNIMVVLLAAAVVVIMLATSYTENLSRGMAENLIRLHVISNSDSPSDQAVKRDVRDAVLSYMQRELESSKSIEQTRSIINGRLDRITAVAEETISGYGQNYSVNAMLGSYPFPTKAYGDIILPAGSYQALRVVIGRGEGANWWCILFPPLCFVDVTYGTVPDSVKVNLRETLTEEEYSIVTSADEESEIPIKIKFKIVELFQDSKIKFASALNRLLKLPSW